MSSSGSGEQRPPRAQRAAPAEQHLGDRLAAFVDGELTGDVRDRVVSHLATCPQCKTAAAEQRRLKSVVAASELPAISAGLLARLQGLPGTDGGRPGDGDGSRDLPGDQDMPPARHERRSPFDGGLLGSGVLGSGRREEFSYLGPGRDLADPRDSRSRGFRIHLPVGAVSPVSPLVPDTDGSAAASAGSASRGRRIAFVAAGAFSLAAIAISGALPLEASVDGGARPDDGPAVSPLSATSSSVSNPVDDTRGVTRLGVLEAPVARDMAPRHVPVVAASATAVSLATGSPVVLR